jgi:hypothetical protein
MLKTLLLVLILLLAFFMAFIPHIGYVYPLHGDEWIHLAQSKAVVEAGSINYPDPFGGKEATGLLSSQEVNYHLLLAMLRQVSGIDWLILFRFGAALVFMLTVLAVYVLCRKEGYGLEAAFFTCLIPTTIGLMGPAFMVPVALGLVFIPLSLFIAFRVKSWPGYLLLFLIACFLWLLHPPTAAVLYIVIAPYILLNLKGNWRHSTGLSAALLVPLLMALPWLWSKLLPALGKLQLSQPLPSHVDIPALLGMLGVLPLILCFIGCIVIARRGDRQGYGLILGLALLLITGLVPLWFQYGMYILYLRSLHTALLLIGLLAGAGLLWVKSIKTPAGNLFCAAAVVAVLAMALPAHLDYPYYHIIDDEDYRAFTWIKENIEADDYPAIVDPWKGSAFTALTGMNVLRYIGYRQILADDLINNYLNDGCPESGFLRDNRVSLVYNRQPCVSSSLLKARDNAYITAADITDGFAITAILQNGGFEAVKPGLLAGWVKASGKTKPDYLFPEPGRTGGSSAGLKMTSAAPYKPWPTTRWQQKVAAQTGSSYIIGGWIKTQEIAGDGGARLALQWRNAANKALKTADLMPYIKGSNSWSYYEYKVTAPAGAATCYVWLELAGCSGTAWFDDITFMAE